MTDQQTMAATRDELADAALKNYEDNVKAAWPNGSSLSTIPQAIEAWRDQPTLLAVLDIPGLESWAKTVVKEWEKRSSGEVKIPLYASMKVAEKILVALTALPEHLKGDPSE